MIIRTTIVALLAGLGLLAGSSTLFAQAKNTDTKTSEAKNTGAKNTEAKRADPFGNFGGNSKDPIRIDADKLEVFDKEQKAIYSGDVIAVRGTTTTRATVMTIFYDNKKTDGPKSGGAVASKVGSSTGPAGQDGALKRIEFKGPVSVVNGTQTATANEMVYDAIAKQVTLKGNAIVADGPNVQRGELMTYDTEKSLAVITNPVAGGRVQGVFTPGSQDEGADSKKKQDRKARPQTN